MSNLMLLVAGALICVSGESSGKVDAVEKQTVTIECPGVTCRGRFSDSLSKNIVKEHDWILSLAIRYEEDAQNWGDLACLDFVIDQGHTGEELAQVLVQSRYYLTDDWRLVKRIPFSELAKRDHGSDR